jgi:hypothetical protein
MLYPRRLLLLIPKKKKKKKERKNIGNMPLPAAEQGKKEREYSFIRNKLGLSLVEYMMMIITNNKLSPLSDTDLSKSRALLPFPHPPARHKKKG